MQFWDGRAETLEEQAKGPVLNPVEMAMPDDKRVVKTLKSMPAYVEAFKKAFPDEQDPVTFDNMASDRRLRAQARHARAIRQVRQGRRQGAQRRAGARLRQVPRSAAACHSGSALGGTSPELGSVKPWPDESDLGRYQVTEGRRQDDVPRRHPAQRRQDGAVLPDGKTAKLEEAVDKMAWHQLGRRLSPDDVKALVAFLSSLAGELPAGLIAEPKPREHRQDAQGRSVVARPSSHAEPPHDRAR